MFALLSVSVRSIMLQAHEEKSFVHWMRETNNMFAGEEYHTRLGIWLTNKRLVQEHNKAGTFLLEMNHLAHYTPEEYRALLGFKHNFENYGKKSEPSNFKAPKSIDWREKNVVNKVKEQGTCGSCWAFATIQSLESQWAILHKTLYVLSEQNLIDCVIACNGCDGGHIPHTYEHIESEQNGKVMLDADYPYLGKQGKCNFDVNKGVGNLTDYKHIDFGNEEDLAAKIAQYGPAAIGIDSSSYTFQLYKEGIYEDSYCQPLLLNHAVGCVGYGSEGGKNYWIIRNSWGEKWGEKGYIRMIKDKNNQCGEATAAYVPVSK